MSEYDGSIRINTEIDTKKASSQLLTLQNRIMKAADKVSSLRSKMDSLRNAKIPTQEYQEITAQIEKAEQKFNRLLEKQEQMQREGKDNGTSWQRLNDQMDEIGNEIRYAKGELQDLVETGKAFTIGSSTDEFSKLSQQLKYAENDLTSLNIRHDQLISKQNDATKGYKKLGDTAKKSLEKVNKSASKSNGLLKTMASRFKGIALSLLVFNWITKAFNAAVKSIKEGFENIYKENNRFKNSVDSLKASATTLKNSLAAAFSPLVEVAIPYIQKCIDWLTKAIDLFAQFTAAIMGKRTYTKAIRQSADATKDQTKATKDAEKEAKAYLGPLDEINRIQSDKKENSQDEVSDPSESVGTMFEEVPIDSNVLSWLDGIKDKLAPILDYIGQLKDAFMLGFWDGLGDWQYRLDSIKDSIASIKESLIDIFTDPGVLEAADGWAKSVAYLLGSLAGSMASIGLTIATNLIGGIAKYLEQNSEKIKEYLISMFNVWEEINYMFSDLFGAIAYLFEAFASEQGQQLTANIIGIFANAFMGITELASKVFRDISSIIIKPFVDNKEAFREALEGFLSVLAEVTGTIKQGIDNTFSKLNEVYDEHFKPFFDSVAQGISDLTGSFLSFWNENVQPILNDWATKFDNLWESHLQPFVSQVIELFGSISDLLKSLLEKVLQPLIQWIIDNILPKVLPIIEEVYNTVVTVIGNIADLLSSFVGIVKGIIDLLVALINGDWSSAWDAAKSIVENIFNAVTSFIELIWNSIIGIISVALETIIGLIETTFQQIYDWIVKIWDDIKTYTTSFFEWISDHIDTCMSDIKELWDNAWEKFGTSVSNIWENIMSIVRSAIDTITGWVDNLFSVFDGVGSKISSLTNKSMSNGPGYSFYTNTYSLPDIPGYANGQVIPRTMKEHLARLGDNNKETEVVSPLSTIKQALKEANMEMGRTSGSGSIIIKLCLDGREVLETIVDAAKLEQISSGNNVFNLT
ncbi:MAG: hypothetical protein MR992_06110 [Lachnospiraceae bacterium]|nr:hypothetical protein [Lachnospiraceae bacterium]MDD7627645.1 hypothetical protein [Lachnospiraceae bacterium]MDY4119471.1 hypothetical protein [Lachnospiraceae bacterium]